MYYVQLEMTHQNGSVSTVGTNSTNDLDKAVSQLLAFRDCAEMLCVAEVIVSYELKLGTVPSVLRR